MYAQERVASPLVIGREKGMMSSVLHLPGDLLQIPIEC